MEAGRKGAGVKRSRGSLLGGLDKESKARRSCKARLVAEGLGPGAGGLHPSWSLALTALSGSLGSRITSVVEHPISIHKKDLEEPQGKVTVS